ncbi:MAG: copper resistance CopC family protein [Lysobacteraceae bacterium]
MIHRIRSASLMSTLMALALLGFAGLASAHSAMTASTPEDGAHLDSPPESVGLRFDGDMRITRFVVTGPDGAVALAQRPGREPTRSFDTAPAQPLGPGTYQVEWRGIAADGHVMTGQFSFHVGD